MNNERKFNDESSSNGKGVGMQVGAVYKTDDLSIFQLSAFNRTVFLKDEMVKQAKEGLISPIIVNESFVVIDGQHRLAAAKVAGVPIEYIVKPGLNKNDIVRMNTIQRPWGLMDFIEAFANQGNYQYVDLSQLVKKGYADLTATVSVAAGNTSASSKSVEEKVRTGKFEFKNYEEAISFLKFYDRFRKETDTPKRKNLCIALYDLCRYPKVDKKRLIKKVVQTGLSEEIKVKSLDKREALKALMDSYNSKLTFGSDKYLNYHVTSNGAVVVDEDLDD